MIDSSGKIVRRGNFVRDSVGRKAVFLTFVPKTSLLPPQVVVEFCDNGQQSVKFAALFDLRLEA